MATKTKLFLIFSVLWVLDAVLTTMLVAQLGTEAEANPAMRYVMETFGMAAFWVIKLSILPGYWYIVKLYDHLRDKYYADRNRRPLDSKWFSPLLITVMTPVIGMNLIVTFDLFKIATLVGIA